MELYYKFRYFLWLKKQVKGKKTVFLLGTPVHENIGDAAIAYAELEYLRQILPKDNNVIEIDQNHMIEYLNVLKKVIRADTRIILHGGGNMGDEWLKEENDRRTVMKTFANNRMIIFPQTIHYRDPKMLRESAKFYGQFKKLTIVAREWQSFEILRDNYKNEIILTPDIVLSLKDNLHTDFTGKRDGCFLCYRNDCETAMSEQTKRAIEAELEKQGIGYLYTDMISQHQILPDVRNHVIMSKLKEIAGARLVITDRLHGMVFCYLTNTPCLVFSNYNHKVLGTYEWIKDANFIKLGDTENLGQQISELLSLRDHKLSHAIHCDDYKEIEMRIMQ